jgi:hypothetical protein
MNCSPGVVLFARIARFARIWSCASLFAVLCAATATAEDAAGPFRFRHHFIERDLPAPGRAGEYGQTALVDLDHDGKLDFVLGRKGTGTAGPLLWYRYEAPESWTKHVAGHDTRSDVGLAALDVDGDGWTDLVTSGLWYRNPGRPREQPFERHVFDLKAGGAHDVLAADFNGDGRLDVALLGDERTELDALVWYEIPTDPRQPWTRRHVGPGVHGAITPHGAGDLDGDGDLDLVRADTWFENADARGGAWTAHRNIPFGRRGPYGVCVRAAVVDMTGDDRPEIVMADADIEDSRVVVLANADGRGGRWDVTELPRSFTYGSLHSLAVADFNGDGRADIASNEQEELLPAGRENPRWVIWENQGDGRYVERIVLDERLGGHELQAGDIAGDGDVDLVSKPWGSRSFNGNGGRMHVDFLENLERP